ncbi:uncharacterized protein J4E92_003903 [Alternaria infectoria]|nr:uncharacterized protein J4E78_005522 [Alternaria triticimaculans]XP_051354315.1 uncharacterized protein J4E92_003903 [Alternaria infectoria]KAI4659098.1 hypothetical protein J4E78_005522 [Alternaria triticimaculans]KAI4932004.1 hypothetical protein J4E92_003903 [Alternaria infectoria]
MRPKALEAVTTPNTEEKSPARQRNSPHQTQDTTKSSSASPRSASDNSTISTDGTTEATPTAAAIVSEVVQTVKTAVDGAIAWAEQKVDKLGAEQDTTGPYTSPATCMPSDLDAIASGILPALPAARQYDGGIDDRMKEGEGTEKSTKTGNGEAVRE